MMSISDRAYDDARMRKLQQEHEERIQRYSVKDREQAFQRLKGSLSYLKDSNPEEFG